MPILCGDIHAGEAIDIHLGDGNYSGPRHAIQLYSRMLDRRKQENNNHQRISFEVSPKELLDRHTFKPDFVPIPI